MKNWYENTERDCNIICPYCGKEYKPSYEETVIGENTAECYEDGLEQTFVCDECGKKFRMIPSLKWEYETVTVDGEMTEEEHETRW